MTDKTEHHIKRIKLLMWLTQRELESLLPPAEKSPGGHGKATQAATMEETDCHLFQDAVDQSLIEVDAALDLLQDRQMALILCQMGGI